MNKLIILDLDGTLLNEYGKVSDYSKKCLAQYEKDNNLVVLTSQRSYSEMLKLHNDLKLCYLHHSNLLYLNYLFFYEI